MSTNYVGVSPQATPLVCTGVAVAATGDTVDGADILNGAVFIVTCAATPCTVTFTDPGHTPAGTAAGSVSAVSVSANTSKAFGKTYMQGFIDPATSKATVAYSATTNITAMVVL